MKICDSTNQENNREKLIHCREKHSTEVITTEGKENGF